MGEVVEVEAQEVKTEEIGLDQDFYFWAYKSQQSEKIWTMDLCETKAGAIRSMALAERKKLFKITLKTEDI